jgi:hypothetical protein
MTKTICNAFMTGKNPGYFDGTENFQHFGKAALAKWRKL